MPTSNLLFLALSLGLAVGLFVEMELKQEMTQGIDTNNIKHKHEISLEISTTLIMWTLQPKATIIINTYMNCWVSVEFLIKMGFV